MAFESLLILALNSHDVVFDRFIADDSLTLAVLCCPHVVIQTKKSFADVRTMELNGGGSTGEKQPELCKSASPYVFSMTGEYQVLYEITIVIDFIT